jgi:UDP-3-O-[3-hydroxymyristoyl] glucosamine N-acyltransferase
MEKLYLPHPGGGVNVEITLALVERLEEGGSLLEMAEKLVAKQLKVTEAVTLLKSVYAHANVAPPPDDFIVAQHPHLHLARLLTAIIAPLSTLGAIDPSKKA